MDVQHRLALRVPDAVAASGIGTTSIYEAMKTGRLAYVKVGARRLIMREDLEKFLESHRVTEAA